MYSVKTRPIFTLMRGLHSSGMSSIVEGGKGGLWDQENLFNIVSTFYCIFLTMKIKMIIVLNNC